MFDVRSCVWIFYFIIFKEVINKTFATGQLFWAVNENLLIHMIIYDDTLKGWKI
jgi:hypothetical protein